MKTLLKTKISRGVANTQTQKITVIYGNTLVMILFSRQYLISLTLRQVKRQLKFPFTPLQFAKFRLKTCKFSPCKVFHNGSNTTNLFFRTDARHKILCLQTETRCTFSIIGHNYNRSREADLSYSPNNRKCEQFMSHLNKGPLCD